MVQLERRKNLIIKNQVKVYPIKQENISIKKMDIIKLVKDILKKEIIEIMLRIRKK